MYQILVYRIVKDLWRWEVRCGGALLRCGTAHTRQTAHGEANGVIHAS